MTPTTIRPAPRPLAVAISLGLLWAAASNAQASTTISASASYSLDGGAVNGLAQTGSDSSNQSVDVLDFSGNGGSSSGIHTYGSVDGSFGSRSSGYGVYDVTGLFSITQSVTNTSSIAQNAVFNFYITPGLLQNQINSDLTPSGSYVSAGIKFDIKRNGGSVWTSEASLTTAGNGTSTSTAFTLNGADIYTQASPTSYNIGGGHYSVDLGVVNAHETISLSYDLSTFANGNAPSTGAFNSPEQTIHVPEQTLYHPEYSYQRWVYDGGYGGYGGYGYGGYGYGGGHYETVTVPGFSEVVAAHDLTVAPYAAYGPSGSHASSGDPFEINFYDGSVQGTYYGANPFTVTTSVPEPESYALAVGGLAVVGALARRRRRSI